MISSNYYIWLQSALGPGVAAERIFSKFSSAEEIFKASDAERRLSGVFRPEQLEKLKAEDVGRTYEVLEGCAKDGIDVITPDSNLYPNRLLEISSYPLALYVKGDISCLLGTIPVSIVGTRKAAPKSISAATELAKALTKSGFTVVSGGALGIDSAAHTGALVAGGKTLAVLGCGIGYQYLMENEPLRCVIAQNGALVSEYPPLTQPFKGTFPMRNRIISGISEATVVIEAGVKSGSLITAKYAYEYGRDVYAFPGESVGSAYAGANELIRDGAKPMTKPWDVVEEYIQKFPERLVIDEDVNLMCDITGQNEICASEKDFRALISNAAQQKGKGEKKKIDDSLSDEARQIYEVFGDESLSVNKIAQTVHMPVNKLLGALTELEIFGYIKLLANTKYELNLEN